MESHVEGHDKSRSKATVLHGWAITKCNLSTSYVKLNMSCVRKVSSAIAIRPSQVAHKSGTWSVLDQEFPVASSFFAGFVNASAVHHSGISSATEFYVVRPDNPYDPQLMKSYADFLTVNSSIFATRYTQLLNTYYHSQVAPYTITGAVPPVGHSALTYSYKNTTGSIQSAQRIVVCHQGWLGILLIAI